jgi:L-amino acid N-acyltransferase YncA
MTSLNLIARDATLDDLPAIVEIYNSTVASRLVTADTEEVTVESRIQWFSEHDPERRPLWVFYLDNRLVGWASLQSFYGRPAYDGTAEISIYLDQRERGKGLGKTVLSHCLQRVGDFGIENVLGFIFAHNVPSLNLFQSFGFEEWGHLPDVAVLDGSNYSLKILGKHVTTS